MYHTRRISEIATKCSLKIQKNEPLGRPRLRFVLLIWVLEKYRVSFWAKINLFRRGSGGRVLCKKFGFCESPALVDQLSNCHFQRSTAIKIAIVLRSSNYLVCSKIDWSVEVRVIGNIDSVIMCLCFKAGPTVSEEDVLPIPVGNASSWIKKFARCVVFMLLKIF
jgi:hypothetical protein